MSFEGKNLYGQYIDYSEKKMAQGLHLPLYWNYFLDHSYIQRISGERLQDHWSSCSGIFSLAFLDHLPHICSCISLSHRPDIFSCIYLINIKQLH